MCNLSFDESYCEWVIGTKKRKSENSLISLSVAYYGEIDDGVRSVALRIKIPGKFDHQIFMTESEAVEIGNVLITLGHKISAFNEIKGIEEFGKSLERNPYPVIRGRLLMGSRDTKP